MEDIVIYGVDMFKLIIENYFYRKLNLDCKDLYEFIINKKKQDNKIDKKIVVVMIRKCIDSSLFEYMLIYINEY